MREKPRRPITVLQMVEQPKLPGRLGYEAAGTVEAIGEGVTGFAIGDKVSTIPTFSMNRYSVYGEQAIVPAAATVKHPDNLSWEQATAIWMQYVTAPPMPSARSA